MNATDKIRILIADDHRRLRSGLVTLLASEPDLEVVGEADSAWSTLELARELTPDIVVMDFCMPDLNGLELTNRMRSELPGIRLVAISMHSDKRYVDRMLGTGVAGYLLKDCAFEELADAIRMVAEDLPYLSTGL